MSRDDLRVRRRDAFGNYFVAELTVSAARDRVVRAAVGLSPVIEAACITTTIGGAAAAAAWRREPQALDRSLFAAFETPATDALRSGAAVVVPSTRGIGPYGEFCRAARHHGFGSAVAVALTVGATPSGVLQLFSLGDDSFDAELVEEVGAFADGAAAMLRNHQAYWEARNLCDSLHVAIESRAEIEQAKGIIMASSACSAEEAFDRLRDQSAQQKLNLRVIAAEIVRVAQRRRP